MPTNPTAPELEVVLPDGRPVSEFEEDQEDMGTVLEFDISPEGTIQQTTLEIGIFDGEEEDFYINLVDEIVEEAPMNATGAAVSTDQPIVRKKKKKDKRYEVWRRAALKNS